MAKKQEFEMVDGGDMTPMIDMVFQLLIFFMILINFSEADQNTRVKLPMNDIVKPPEGVIPDSLTLQIAKGRGSESRNFSVLISVDEIRTPIDRSGDVTATRTYKMNDLKSVLNREVDFVKRQNKTARDMTVIIRADGDVRADYLLSVIRTCQSVGIEKFALRAQKTQ